MDLGKLLSAIQPPQGTRPQFSGGVSGVGQPFIQQMPNMVPGAMQGMQQRMQAPPALPTLGQLIAGG